MLLAAETTQSYRTQEFAKLAGVTVRALHHYDELGLLKPGRTLAGYRVYTLVDLERLEQIVALKFIGIPLKQIKLLLDRNPLALPDALRAQRAALIGKRAMLDHAIRAIEEAERSLDPAKLKRIIEVMDMESNTQWAEKYYSPEAREKIEERKKLWNPELQEQVTADWNQLFADVRAAMNEDPASPVAQSLAARWRKLVEGFTGGDPAIHSGLNELWKDRANWPEPAKQQSAAYSDPEVWAFIQRAMAASKK